jgi:hypothetical protein
VVAEVHVERLGRLQQHLREREKKEALDEIAHRWEALQREQRTDWVGAFPHELAAIFRLKRLGQHEEPPEPVDRGAAGRKPERQPQIVIAEQPAEHWSDDEADAERRTEQPERLRAFSRWRDVDDVSIRRRENAGGEPGDGARDEEPARVGAFAMMT